VFECVCNYIFVCVCVCVYVFVYVCVCVCMCVCLSRDSQESSPTPQFRSIHSLALTFLYSLTLTFAMHIVHTAIFKMDNKHLLYSTGNSAQCYVAAWMAGEFGGE